MWIEKKTFTKGKSFLLKSRINDRYQNVKRCKTIVLWTFTLLVARASAAQHRKMQHKSTNKLSQALISRTPNLQSKPYTMQTKVYIPNVAMLEVRGRISKQSKFVSAITEMDIRNVIYRWFVGRCGALHTTYNFASAARLGIWASCPGQTCVWLLNPLVIGARLFVRIVISILLHYRDKHL